MKTHAAPVSTVVLVISVVATLICLGAGAIVYMQADGDIRMRPLLALLPVLVLVVAAIFSVRGYVITADELLIRRLLWSTRLRRAELESATADREALRGSIRLFGNGGLYSFTGLFRSRALGRYHAYVTDPARTVILRFKNRTIVVSPENPEAFVRDITAR